MSMNGRNYARSIAQSIAQQESNLMRRGELSDWRFSQIRQRHLWSTYHFNSCTSGSAIQWTAGVPTIQPGEYVLFTALRDQNGQGLPQGLLMSAADTNNLGSGRVPDDQNFAFWELGASIYRARQDVVTFSEAMLTQQTQGNPHPDDVDRILCEGVLSIQYLTNKVPLGHLMDFAQSGGPNFDVPSLLSYTVPQQVTGAGISGGLGDTFSAVAAPPQVPYNSRVGRHATNSGNANPNPGTRRKLEVPIFLAATQTYNLSVTFTRPVQLRSLLNGGSGCFTLRLDAWAVESFRNAG